MKKYVLLLGVLVSVLFVQAEEWQVFESEKNLVKFVSDAPVEDFEGLTSKVDGYLFWDGDDMLNKSDFYFEVDLNTLDTGIGLRNRHMRENYLETEKFPTTHFKGSLIKIDKSNPNEITALAQGKMFIHGVERLKSVQVTIKKEGDKLRVIGEFEVKLSDYGITVPSIMFYKIDEAMQLKIDFSLHQPKS